MTRFIYYYYRLFYAHFEPDDDPHFKSVGAMGMAFCLMLGIVFSTVDYLSPGYINLPERSRGEMTLYILCFYFLWHYSVKYILVHFAKVETKTGVSSLYNYSPSNRAAKYNIVAHALLLAIFLFLGYLRV